MKLQELILIFSLFVINPFFLAAQEIKLSGTISAENNNIVNVADPIDNYDATNKRYVDNSQSSFNHLSTFYQEEVYYVEHERYDINRYSYDHFGNLISETRVELRDSSNDYQYDSISVHNDLEYDDKGHWIKRTQFQQETVIADGERIDQESYYPLITKRYLIYQKGED